MTKKLLGHAAVDSGQILITDPCYLNEWEDNEFDSKEKSEDKSYSYNGACHATLSKEGGGEIGKLQRGVATSTGYGDGCYPVYATYNKEGRIMKVEINFN